MFFTQIDEDEALVCGDSSSQQAASRWPRGDAASDCDSQSSSELSSVGDALEDVAEVQRGYHTPRLSSRECFEGETARSALFDMYRSLPNEARAGVARHGPRATRTSRRFRSRRRRCRV